MQTNLQNVPIGAIEILHNYREVHPPTEKDPDIIELSQDIKANGIYQAIMLRPHPVKKNIFQIIFGHRRFIAAKLAGLATIPANVREVANDQVLEIQVTENLQRKDCHPMDEAVAYKQLMEKKKYSVQEIAGRFAKTPEYITQRLKLNDLIEPSKKDFKADRMLLGHALLLCKLTPDDQKDARYMADNDFSNQTIANLNVWIQRQITRDLTKAPWDLGSLLLYPKAGPCTTCAKRSSAGNLLFADMNVFDNRCFDSKCFAKKSDISFYLKLQEVIHNQPDILLLSDSNDKIPADISKLISDMKLKVLKEYTDFNDSNYDRSFGIRARGIYINSRYNRGKISVVYLKGSAKKVAGKAVDENVNAAEVIKGIKERTTRAAELDAEKVHARILEDFKKHTTQKEVDAKMKSLPEPEAVAMVYILFELLGYPAQKEVASLLKLKGFDFATADIKKSASFYQSLRDINTGELALIIRKVMLDKHRGTTGQSRNGYIIRKMAESYKDIPVQQYEAEQKQIRDKRENNAAARIAALQPSSLRYRSKKAGSKPKKATSLRGPSLRGRMTKQMTKQTVKKK